MTQVILDVLKRHKRLSTAAGLLFGMVLYAQPALAAPPLHESPKGSEWVMADWMFLSFIIFAGVAFMAFILALKAGWLSNLEDAKYYVLDIQEEDFYRSEYDGEGDET